MRERKPVQVERETTSELETTSARERQRRGRNVCAKEINTQRVKDRSETKKRQQDSGRANEWERHDDESEGGEKQR